MKKHKKRNNQIAPFVVNFCKNISPETPILVPLRPLLGKPANECFTIVPEHVVANGGKQNIGWCIHVWKGVLIEAEFHCTWESPEGEILDITPKMFEAENIIFLPDPTKSYTGRQVDNIRKSISSDMNVEKFIMLAQEYYRYINHGDLADYHGEIEIKEDFIDQYDLMQKMEFYLMRKFGNDRGIATSGGFVRYHLPYIVRN